MAFFNNHKIKTIPLPIPAQPAYVPPVVPEPPEPVDGTTPIIPTDYNQISGITIYQCTDEPATLNKTLSNGISLTGAIRNGTDVLNPIIDNVSPVVGGVTYDLTKYNYCKIDFYNNAVSVRYYYMRVVLEPNNRFRLILSEDELTTFKDGIKNCYGILSATEDERYFDKDLDDGTYINDNGAAIRINVFDNGFLETPQNILITCGVGGNAPDPENGGAIGVLNNNNNLGGL